MQHREEPETENRACLPDGANQASLAAQEAVDLLLDLQAMLRHEEAAIKDFDDAKLEVIGDEIEKLLDRIAVSIKQETGSETFKENEVKTLLNNLRLQREKNRNLLENTLEKTLLSIKKTSTGRRAIQAYFAPGADHALFLKKNC